jgi:hypothetical protein
MPRRRQSAHTQNNKRERSQLVATAAGVPAFATGVEPASGSRGPESCFSLVPRIIPRRWVPRMAAGIILTIFFFASVLTLVAWLPVLQQDYKYLARDAVSGIVETTSRITSQTYYGRIRSPFEIAVGQLVALEADNQTVNSWVAYILLRQIADSPFTNIQVVPINNSVRRTYLSDLLNRGANNVSLSLRRPISSTKALTATVAWDSVLELCRQDLDNASVTNTDDFRTNLQRIAEVTDGAAALRVSGYDRAEMEFRWSLDDDSYHSHLNSDVYQTTQGESSCVIYARNENGAFIGVLCAHVTDVPHELQGFILFAGLAVLTAGLLTMSAGGISFLIGRLWVERTQRHLACDLARYAPPQPRNGAIVEESLGSSQREVSRKTIAAALIGFHAADEAYAGDAGVMLDSVAELKDACIEACREFGACPANLTGAGGITVIGPTTGVVAVALKLSSWQPTKHKSALRRTFTRRSMATESDAYESHLSMTASQSNNGALGERGPQRMVVGEAERVPLRIGVIIHAFVGCSISPMHEIADWHDCPSYQWRTTGRDVALLNSLRLAVVPGLVIATHSARGLMAQCRDEEHVALHIAPFGFGVTESQMPSGERCLVTGSILTRRVPRQSDRAVPGADACAQQLRSGGSDDHPLFNDGGELPPSQGPSPMERAVNVLSVDSLSTIATDPARSSIRDRNASAEGESGFDGLFSATDHETMAYRPPRADSAAAAILGPGERGRALSCAILRALEQARETVPMETRRRQLYENLPTETWNVWKSRRGNVQQHKRATLQSQYNQPGKSILRRQTYEAAKARAAAAAAARAGHSPSTRNPHTLSDAVGFGEGRGLELNMDPASAANSMEPATLAMMHPMSPATQMRQHMAASPDNSDEEDEPEEDGRNPPLDGNAPQHRPPSAVKQGSGPTRLGGEFSDLKSAEFQTDDDALAKSDQRRLTVHDVQVLSGKTGGESTSKGRRTVSFSTAPPTMVSIEDTDTDEDDEGLDNDNGVPLPAEFLDETLRASPSTPTCVVSLTDARVLCNFVLEFLPRREWLKIHTAAHNETAAGSSSSGASSAATNWGRMSPQHLSLIRSSVSLASHFLVAFRTLSARIDLGATHRMMIRVSAALAIEPPLPSEEDQGDTQHWFARLAARCAVLVITKMRSTTMWSPALPVGTPASWMNTPNTAAHATVSPRGVRRPSSGQRIVAASKKHPQPQTQMENQEANKHALSHSMDQKAAVEGEDPEDADALHSESHDGFEVARAGSTFASASFAKRVRSKNNRMDRPAPQQAQPEGGSPRGANSTALVELHGENRITDAVAARTGRDAKPRKTSIDDPYPELPPPASPIDEQLEMELGGRGPKRNKRRTVREG